MSLDATLADTRESIATLKDALEALRVTVVEDGPSGQQSVLVERLGDAVLDAQGLAHEAWTAAAESVHAAEPPLDVEHVRFRLAACDDALRRCLRRVLADLHSPRRGEDLAHIARRGQQWRMWSTAVGEAVERCAEPLCDAIGQLGVCWRDVAERGSTVSVHATNVGQQITVPAGSRPVRTAEGVT